MVTTLTWGVMPADPKSASEKLKEQEQVALARKYDEETPLLPEK